jgi:hypothetical protein
MTGHDPFSVIESDVFVDFLADLAVSDQVVGSLDRHGDAGWRAGLVTLAAATHRPGEPSELAGEEHVVAAMADAIRGGGSDAPRRPRTGPTVRRAVAAKSIAVTAIALGVATAAAAGVTVNLVVPDGGSEPRQRPQAVATTLATDHDDGETPGTVACEPADEVCRSLDPGEATTPATLSTTTSLPATTDGKEGGEVTGRAAPPTDEPGAAADTTPAATHPTGSTVPTSPTTTVPSAPVAGPGPPVDPGPPDGAGPPEVPGPPATIPDHGHRPPVRAPSRGLPRDPA